MAISSFPDLGGSMTALVTPMKPDGSFDEKAYSRFIDWQIEQGTEGLVPVGTTGESPTLSHEEHNRVVALCIEAAAKRVPVVAGTGSNNTKEAIYLTQHAKEAGADAALIVTPYYNKPTQSGLYAHFAAIAEAVEIPIVIYNIPGRSVIDLSVETLARLVKAYPHIIGVKDATADIVRPIETRQALKREVPGVDFRLLSGEDAPIAAFLAHGGHGVISVVSNVAPALSRKLHDCWRKGDLAGLAEARESLFVLSTGMFAFGAPTATVKQALSMMGMMDPTVRLPLVELSAGEKHRLSELLKESGLIN